MLMPAYLHLKRAAVVFMSRSFKVVATLMSSWGLALFSCMQAVGAGRTLGECSTTCHHMIQSLGMPYLEDVPCLESVQNDVISRCGHLDHHDVRTCEMWAMAEGTGTISTNATGVCMPKPCYLCGDAECMCQHSCPLKCAGVLMSRSFKSRWQNQMSL
jgi:hypothetical protein